jgi:hypothetical protein
MLARITQVDFDEVLKVREKYGDQVIKQWYTWGGSEGQTARRRAKWMGNHEALAHLKWFEREMGWEENEME